MKRLILLFPLFLATSIAADLSYSKTDGAEDSTLMLKIDSISVSVDSIKNGVMLVSKNTDGPELFNCNIDWFNFIFAFAAFVVACFSAVYDFRGFRESKRTADNVTRVSLDVQIAQFNDLIRHLYRNQICSMAFGRILLETGRHTGYPSEEHLLKLKVLPEDVLHLERYNQDNKIYKKMHELKLLLRNYDIEIDTAMMHMKDRKIKDISVLRNDLDTLFFKPLFLIRKILLITEDMKHIKSSGLFDVDVFRNAAAIMVGAHVSNLNEHLGQFKDGNYESLNFVNAESKIAFPYDGLRRSLSMLLSHQHVVLDIADIFGRGSDACFKYDDLVAKMAKGHSRVLGQYKECFAVDGYDFNADILTMIAVDVAIEVTKIHMIEFAE